MAKYVYPAIFTPEKNGTYIMMVKVEYKSGQALTREQIAEIEAAKRKPIVYDEDSPELTPAMEKAFRCSAAQRNRKKRA